MSVFGKVYSAVYDLLYKDKNYSTEVAYVLDLIKSYGERTSGMLLDLGCGTGKHLPHFENAGFDISGVDLSDDMVAQAKKSHPNMSFYCSDIQDFKLHKTFDVAVSLFHVVSYLTSYSQMRGLMRSVYQHLKPGGVFIFDFWYGPAVLMDLPEVRVKRCEDEFYELVRISEPTIHEQKNVVEVNFNSLIKNKETGERYENKEQHLMRYWFIEEIRAFAEEASFEFVASHGWMNKDVLSAKCWYGVVVLRK